jgi:hypothetical protein
MNINHFYLKILDPLAPPYYLNFQAGFLPEIFTSISALNNEKIKQKKEFSG